MSQIATFLAMDRDRLPELVEAARARRDFEDVFARTTREIDTFDGPGYGVAMALVYLHDNDIPMLESGVEEADALLSDAGGVSTFLFTPEHKQYLPYLDPAAHDEAKLRRYFEEFNEEEDEQAGRAMLEGLAALRRHVEALDDGTVLLLRVG